MRNIICSFTIVAAAFNVHNTSTSTTKVCVCSAGGLQDGTRRPVARHRTSYYYIDDPPLNQPHLMKRTTIETCLEDDRTTVIL